MTSTVCSLLTCVSAPEYTRTSSSLNSACSFARCSGVAERHCGPTAERVTTSKLTFGITLLSTSLITGPMSPDWMDLSAFTASSTSVEMARTKASGATSAAKAVPAKPARSERAVMSLLSM